MTLGEATVLVVEDEPVLRMTFAVVLKQLGLTVHTAANGLEALEVLERERIDAMLTDKHMPQMDGSTLLETLHQRGTSVPSILFVSAVEPESPQDMRRWGVVETVMKPLHPERLKHMVADVLLAAGESSGL